MSILAFVTALALFLGLLAATPFQFRISYRRTGQDDSATVVLSGLFGLWQYTLDIPMLDWRWSALPHLRVVANESTAPGQANMTETELKPRGINLGLIRRILGKVLVLVREMKMVKRWFYKGIRCKHLRWVFEVGLKDAAETGIAVGAIWSVIGYYLGKLNTNITFEVANPQVAVYPSFRQPIFKADIDCIFKLRIGHIIIAGFKMLRIVRNGLKGVKLSESPN
ncbi:MAG TPA: DUF2953 domain-containing protein [Verrucomicrobiae bacterium]|nr:DUF2953 domain-containing protein [Verrucomicrobiae bacterium]